MKIIQTFQTSVTVMEGIKTELSSMQKKKCSPEFLLALSMSKLTGWIFLAGTFFIPVWIAVGEVS